MAAALSSRITRRQTTFWDFLGADGVSRVHFRGKKAYRIAGDEVPSYEVVRQHPLLVDYLELHTSIFLAGVAPDPSTIHGELVEALAVATSRWNDAGSYLNDASITVLRDGYGMLFTGPESLGKAVATVLSRAAVAHTVLPAGGSPTPVQVLVAGENWVVAEEFQIEELPSDKSLERTRER